jgi:hypothetical protein
LISRCVSWSEAVEACAGTAATLINAPKLAPAITLVVRDLLADRVDCIV